MRLTSWCVKGITFLSTALVLNDRYEIGAFGVALVLIVAVVWAAASYMEVLS